MRKQVLATSTEVDSFARRKQKLLDKKRKRDSKGKAVAPDQLPRDDTAEVEASSKAALLKMAEQTDIPVASHDPFAEERIQLLFPLDGSFFSEPKDLLVEARKCLLPEDEKRFLSLGHRKAAERSLLQSFQALQGTIYMEREMTALSLKNKEVVAMSNSIKKELRDSRNEVEALAQERSRQEENSRRLELERKAEVKVLQEQIEKLKSDLARWQRRYDKLADEKENCELSSSTAMSYRLMKEFLDHKGEQWDPEKVIREYEELQELEEGLSAGSDVGEELEGHESGAGGGEEVEVAGDDGKVDEEMENADTSE